MIAKYLEEHQITMRTEYVPTAYPDGTPLGKHQINWRVTLIVAGKDVLTTPFSQGIGHLPVKIPRVRIYSLADEEELHGILQTGKYERKPLSPPTVQDVLYCLLMDGEAINYNSFEQWANECGYDTDSRKAEAAYRECLATGLTLRNAFGEKMLRELIDLYQDY